MAETMSGLREMLNRNPPAQPSPALSPAGSSLPNPGFTPPPVATPASVPAPDGGLPSLGIRNESAEAASDETQPASLLASKAAQAGQMLSSENVSDSSIDFARSVGEGYINQQLSDWLNQKGTAKVSLGSDKKVSGDLLLPLMESDNNLLFAQAGLHSNEDRNFANLGFGYRQYVDGWMYGVNTFYDYDYSGRNARLGVGGEAWTDYLKLAVNGYFSLTDWHQSRLRDMQDYDERPANGYDVRAQAWLPSMPQLGGEVKYERYFGKNIDLGGGHSPDELKDDPHALTLGVSYTPFPLITFTGERSIGDSNDTRIGMDLNYRFGVPLWQQLNPEAVDIQRSLVGSKYELVDRNYEIVMQYRKQILLQISTPPQMSPEAGEMIHIPVTIDKAKYGVRSIEWRASANFTANGGTYRQLSMTELEVSVPRYVFDRSRSLMPAQDYTLTAIGTDNNGNKSNAATTVLKVTPSSQIISQMIVVPQTALLADNSQAFTVTAKVVDKDGRPLPTQHISFEVAQLNDGATLFTDEATDGHHLSVYTNNLGLATVQVKSKVAAQGLITAEMDNGNYNTARLNFVADPSTAGLTELTVVRDRAFADGVHPNVLQATVKDGFGNPVPDYTVNFSADHGAVAANGGTALTDAQGHATLNVTNTQAVSSSVTAEANGVSLTKRVTFVVDKSTARIASGDLTVTQDALANGVDSNNVTVKVTDTQGNPVPGVTLQLSVGRGATIAPTQVVSDGNGVARASITSRRATSYGVRVNIVESGNSATATTRFIADASTAQIREADLAIAPDGALANGSASNGVIATVTDANGNLVPGVAVAFRVSTGAIITTTVGTTGADGKAKATVTSQTVGSYTVTASANGQSVSKPTRFVADLGTARITAANLTIAPDGSAANGLASNGVSAIVTDANNNLVPGAPVQFAVSAGAVLTTLVGTTGADGKATAKVTSRVAGTYTVNAKVNGQTTSKPTLFIADATTATLTSANLTVVDNNAIADGTHANRVRAKVTDANGNVVPGVSVAFRADNSASIAVSSVTTDESGLAETTLTSLRAGSANVTATVNGSSRSVSTTFIADASSARITSANLVIDPDGRAANGVAANGVTATVTDANNNLVPNEVVTFSVSSGAVLTTLRGTTGADGKATAKITSQAAGQYTVSAVVNGQTTTKPTIFVADTGTATIVSGDLTVTSNHAVANGDDTNSVQAKVTDAQGNPVPGVNVTFAANNGATMNDSVVVTNTSGIAENTLTNVRAGMAKVRATVNNSNQMVDTHFVADLSTAQIAGSNLTINPDGSVADGVATNGVTAIVTDDNSNLVPGAVVTFTVSTGATVTTVIGTTGSDGKATATVTSRVAGSYTVNAGVNGRTTSKPTRFVADSGTATITSGNLTVTDNNAVADGTASNRVQAKVTDANGNVVAGATVTFSADNGATVVTTSAVTAADGTAATRLTSLRAGTANVSATVNGNSASVATTFTANSGTAQLTDASLTISPDGALADGTAKNGVTAIVRDANNNLTSGVAVSFTVSSGALISTVIGTTGADGKATATVTSITAGSYTVTARANGSTASKETHFVADEGSATIINGNLTVAKNNAIADGTDANRVQAKVTDANGNAVPGVTVIFSADGGASLADASVMTGADGVAQASLTSQQAKTINVSAAINGHSQSVATVFTANATTAEIADANLTISPNGAAANGTAKNGVTAIITDANNNLVPGATVSFSVSSGATITTVTGTTGADGKATATVTSLVAGDYTVTARVNGGSTSKTATFVADSTTATIVDANLTIDPDGSLANGSAKNGVTAVVTDAQGNLVSGAAVSFSVSTGASLQTVTGTTGADGKASATVTSTTAGSYTVSATVNSNTTSKPTRFIADSSTATITSANLVISPDNAIANGMDVDGVTATVTDAQGNIVPGVEVAFSVATGATLTTLIGTTGADGKATAEVTSQTAKSYAVSATANGHTVTKNASFIADSSTAEIGEANLVIDPDRSAANGIAKNGVTATVTDANGNLVSGAVVDFRVSAGASLLTVIGTTGADGRATATVTSTTAGSYTVTAETNDSEVSKPTTFIADTATATLIDGALTVTKDGAIADGEDHNGVLAKVTDANGNTVSGVVVTFSADNGGTLAQRSVTTNASGIAVASITSTTAGTSNVQASINGVSRSVATRFIADSSTAQITSASLTISPDNAKANGVDTDGVTAIVRDSHGNLVSGAVVSFSVGTGATIATVIGTTGADGKATAKVTSLKAGSYVVTASTNGSSATKSASFVADASTARIVDSDLVISPDGAVANNIATNGATATVTDANGNKVSGVAVSFSVGSGATLTTVTGTTGSDGKATATIVSKKAGSHTVTAMANGSSVNKPTLFIADASTARILEANLVTTSGAIANGTASNAVTATVVDANDNKLAGIAVSFSVTTGATLTTLIGTTGADGKATAKVTSLIAGSYTVTATANSTSATEPTTFIADAATAVIASVTLDGALLDKVANGTDVFTYKTLVKDAKGNVVPNVAVTWSQDKATAVTLTASSTTDAQGIAVATLKSTRTETLGIQVSAALANNIKVNADKKVNFNAQLVKLFGTVKNAVNASAIAGVALKIYANDTATEALYNVTTGSDGKYSVNIKQGSYYVRATKTGFIEFKDPIDVANVVEYQKDFTMSPLLNGDAARIVLTWEAQPTDLDSHLLIPGGTHLFFGNKTPAGADANLDLDDTTSFGPETVTIRSMHTGSYCYYVKRYSNEPRHMNGARVKLYLSDGSEYTYSIPSTSKTYWSVFKLKSVSGNYDVITQNSYSDSEPAGCS
ncbi:MAG: Ig-like domain-containing protein [Scandinavium sp.]|uniref:Ig-like domain-containing protein n=1 Tax=Scandinavium sp. TaxID=2830653 RepID=UPI003F2FCB17